MGAAVVKGSPEGGFMTLVWRAESELVLGKEEERLAEWSGTFRGRGCSITNTAGFLSAAVSQ